MSLKLLSVFLLSMVPVIELRGAIPLGVGFGIPLKILFPLCIVGNLLPVPFAVLFSEKLLGWLSKQPVIGGFFTRFLKRAHEKAGSITGAVIAGLFMFVAIPLPGTGAWTGSVVAALLGMRVRKAFPPIAAGVVAAGIIMAVGSYGLFAVIK